MKLYKADQAPAGRRWHPTKALAQQLSRETGVGFDEVEVGRGEGREGMAAFLNANELEVMPKDGPGPGPEGPDELEEAEMRAVAARTEAQTRREEQVNRAWTATDIEDFILDRADVNQVGNIFSCLGSRFKEMAKELESASKA